MISDKVRAIPVPKMAAFFNLPPDVISLGLGEPGFSTSSVVGDGAVDAIRSGKTFYPPSNGYAELKELLEEGTFKSLAVSMDANAPAQSLIDMADLARLYTQGAMSVTALNRHDVN